MTFSDLWEMVEEFTKENSSSGEGYQRNNGGIGWYYQHYDEEDTAVRRAIFKVLKTHRMFLEIIAMLYSDLAWCYLFTGRPLLASP
ncbi:unnamed protein product, partial [Rotaria sordida]